MLVNERVQPINLREHRKIGWKHACYRKLCPAGKSVPEMDQFCHSVWWCSWSCFILKSCKLLHEGISNDPRYELIWFHFTKVDDNFQIVLSNRTANLPFRTPLSFYLYSKKKKKNHSLCQVQESPLKSEQSSLKYHRLSSTASQV